LKADVCKTEAEAREKMAQTVDRGATARADKLPTAAFNKWPVYFFESDTSGEKTFEEFYTPGEVLDLDTFVNLGVVKNAKRRDIKEIDGILGELRGVFTRQVVTKAQVVDVLKEYLPNFAHIETGKSLDQKM